MTFGNPTMAVWPKNDDVKLSSKEYIGIRSTMEIAPTRRFNLQSIGMGVVSQHTEIKK